MPATAYGRARRAAERWRRSRKGRGEGPALTPGQHGHKHDGGGPQVSGRRAIGALGSSQHLGRGVRHRAAHARQKPLTRAVPARKQRGHGHSQAHGEKAEGGRRIYDYSPKQRGHAEVGDLEVVLVVEQQVLGLDVAVRDATLVQVAQRAQQLRVVAARGAL